MIGGLEIKSKQIDSMKTKQGWGIFGAKKLKDYDEDIEGYLDTNTDDECSSVFDHIKMLHEKLEERAYKFNPINLPIYIEQIVGDLICLYSRAFKLMLENMKRKPKQKEDEDERKVRESNAEKGFDYAKSKSRQKFADWGGPEIDMSNWAENSVSVLKDSNGKTFSNNLMAMPASDPFLFYRESSAPSMSFESPSMDMGMTFEP